MSDYRSRVLSGVMVTPDLELTEVEGPLGQLLSNANIKYLETVRGAHSRHNDFVMVIDEDGHDRRLQYNPKAQYLSGYPVHHAIVGAALFFSERMIDMGMDLVDLTPKGRDFLKHPRSGGIQLGFTEWMNINGDHTMRHSVVYPAPFIQSND
jgi:hypothetical protein